MEVGDAFSYGAICTTTDLPPPGCEIISPNDRISTSTKIFNCLDLTGRSDKRFAKVRSERSRQIYL